MSEDANDEEASLAQEAAAPKTTRRKKLTPAPPIDVCYAAGAAIAAKNAFVILLDEWAWYKSELRNYMIAHGLDEMRCPIAGQLLRVRLVPNVISVCECHSLELTACAQTMNAIAKQLPVAVRTIEQSSVVISVEKSDITLEPQHHDADAAA